MKIYIGVFLTLIFTSCYIGTELPPDQKVWEYDQPSNNGLSEEILLQIDEAISFDQFESIHAVTIIKDGKMVFENYYDTTKRKTIIPLETTSITVTVAALGVALDLRLLDLDDPIFQYLPEYQSVFDATPEKQNITIRHLLLHRSGFSWNETLTGIFGNPDNNFNQMVSSEDWIEFVLNQPLEAGPGLRYNFNSGGGTILAKIIQNASGQSFEDFVNDNILSALGVSSFNMAQDPSGNFDGGRGAFMSYIDWGKFGYLMLSEGIWNDRRVIDPNFVDEATSLQISVSSNTNFGFGWSLFGDGFTGLFPFDKDNAYYSRGTIGQHMYIVPDQNMMVFIYAENFFFGFNNPSLNLFIQLTSAIQ